MYNDVPRLTFLADASRMVVSLVVRHFAFRFFAWRRVIRLERSVSKDALPITWALVVLSVGCCKIVRGKIINALSMFSAFALWAAMF